MHYYGLDCLGEGFGDWFAGGLGFTSFFWPGLMLEPCPLVSEVDPVLSWPLNAHISTPRKSITQIPMPRKLMVALRVA